MRRHNKNYPVEEISRKEIKRMKTTVNIQQNVLEINIFINRNRVLEKISKMFKITKKLAEWRKIGVFSKFERVNHKERNL